MTRPQRGDKCCPWCLSWRSALFLRAKTHSFICLLKKQLAKLPSLEQFLLFIDKSARPTPDQAFERDRVSASHSRQCMLRQ